MDGAAAGAAAAAPAASGAEQPTPEQRAAMEALGVAHLMDEAEQQAFIQRVNEGLESGSPHVSTMSAAGRALHEAAEAGNVGAVVAALEGADVNVRGDDGDTALHLASLYGKVEVARELLQRGADPNVRDGDNSTPLHDCCAGGYRDIAYYLLDRGADVNAQDDDGDTPLHQACNGDHGEVVALLLQRGANTTIKNGANRLPITMSRNPQVLAAFQQAMAVGAAAAAAPAQ